MKLLALLFAAASASVLLGQTWTPRTGAESNAVNIGTDLGDQLRSLPKRFLPELLSTTDPHAAKLSATYCVYGGLDTKSISIKRCQPPPSRFRLVAPLKNVAPENKPPLNSPDAR